MENVPYIEDIPCGVWASKESLVEENSKLRVENQNLQQRVNDLESAITRNIEELDDIISQVGSLEVELSTTKQQISTLTKQRDAAVDMLNLISNWGGLCVSAYEEIKDAIKSIEVMK
jgi:regulator of replication initiation timing